MHQSGLSFCQFLFFWTILFTLKKTSCWIKKKMIFSSSAQGPAPHLVSLLRALLFLSTFQVTFLATLDQCTFIGHKWHAHFFTNVPKGTPCPEHLILGHTYSLEMEGIPLRIVKWLKQGWDEKTLIQTPLFEHVRFSFWASFPPLFSKGSYICLTYLMRLLRRSLFLRQKEMSEHSHQVSASLKFWGLTMGHYFHLYLRDIRDYIFILMKVNALLLMKKKFLMLKLSKKVL